MTPSPPFPLPPSGIFNERCDLAASQTARHLQCLRSCWLRVFVRIFNNCDQVSWVVMNELPNIGARLLSDQVSVKKKKCRYFFCGCSRGVNYLIIFDWSHKSQRWSWWQVVESKQLKSHKNRKHHNKIGFLSLAHQNNEFVNHWSQLMLHKPWTFFLELLFCS